MASLHHNAIKQKYKHIFTQFSKILKFALGPKIKLRYGQSDFVTFLKIGKNEFHDVKVLGIHLIFEWPKSIMAQDRKMETKFSFKIIGKDGRHFTREVEMNITASNKSTGFDSFLPISELNGDYFLENDQLSVEVEGVIEPPSYIEHTKNMIIRIPYISKMKKSHSSVLFKHDLGLQWKIHTEYYEGDRPGYDVYLEAVGPNYKWTCDAHTRLGLVRNFKDVGFNRTKGLKLSNNCTTLQIGQYHRDEVFDPANGFVDGFDTLTFQFFLHIYHINGLHPNYEDCIRGIMPIVMNKLPDDGLKMKSNLSFEIKIPKLSEFKSVAYSVLDYAQNLYWVAFLRVEKIAIINELETEALGVYVHCFDPNGLTNWSCESDVRFILNAKRIENNLERHRKHSFSHKENTFGYKNMVLMKEIVFSKRNYLLNNGITVAFKIECKPRQVIDEPVQSTNIPGIIDTQGSIKMTVKDFSKFSDVQVTPDWVNIGNTAFKIMLMTHHKLFHNTVVDKVLAFYVKCDSNRKPADWRCNTQVALKMKCHLPEMTDLVLKFEHQFSKDVVCFGYEEFLLVSVILNPAHGFILNDSIELEAVIEIVNEELEDYQVVNRDTNGEKYIEACIDENLGDLWNNQKIEQVALEGNIMNDKHEEQREYKDVNIPIPDVNAAFITQEFDVPEKLALEKGFNYEAIEACAPTLICDTENPKVEVVIIKTEIVDESYSDKAPIVLYDCEKEKEVTIKKENDYDETRIDIDKDEMVQNSNVEDVENAVKTDGFNNLEVEPQEVNLLVTINGKVGEEESKFEQQLDANVDCMQEIKMVAMDNEEHTQAESDCVNNNEPIVASEEVVTISKVEDNPVQLDNKQSITVENLHSKCTLESKDDVSDDFKQENKNISDENHIIIVDAEVNITLKKDELEEPLDAEVYYKKEDQLKDLEYEKESTGTGDCDEKTDSSEEVLTASNITVDSVVSVDDKDLHSTVKKDLYLEIKLDHNDEISCQNCEVNINQEENDVTDGNQDLMNSICPENKTLDVKDEEIKIEEVHVIEEEKDKLEAFEDEEQTQVASDCVNNKEPLVASEEVETVSKFADEANVIEEKEESCVEEQHAALQEVEIFPKFADEANVTDEKEESCVEGRHAASQEDEIVSKLEDDLDVTEDKEEACAEEKNAASQEVEIVSKLEDDLSHLNKMDLLSPAVQSLCLNNELDSEDKVSCMNKSDELCVVKEDPYSKDNEGISKIQRNNLKDVIIPKIIIDKYEDYVQLEETKSTSSPVDDDVSEKSVDGQ